jgi:hypothetical protein
VVSSLFACRGDRRRRMVSTRRIPSLWCLSGRPCLELIDQRAWCLSGSIGAGVVVWWSRRGGRRRRVVEVAKPESMDLSGSLHLPLVRVYAAPGAFGAPSDVGSSILARQRRRRFDLTRRASSFWRFRPFTYLESIDQRAWCLSGSIGAGFTTRSSHGGRLWSSSRLRLR